MRIALGLVAALVLGQIARAEPIDRRAVVSRHDVVQHVDDPFGTLSIGNGSIAFNFDITGLQTFPAAHEKAIPLGTLADWSWHSFPNPAGYAFEKFKMASIPKHGRAFVYPASGTAHPSPEAAYLRANPHRFGIVQVGLVLAHPDGSAGTPADVREATQTLALWTGQPVSTFTFDGQPVTVRTAVHPDRDELAVRVESPLIAAGCVKVRVAFPYASDSFGPDYQEWGKPESHATTMSPGDARHAHFARTMDATNYGVDAAWSNGGILAATGPHQFVLASSGESLELVLAFSPEDAAKVAATDAVAEIQTAASRHWEEYWAKGGIIDFTGTADPRAAEIERRLILSQYLMAVHDAGREPGAETGLAANSWFGKFHMEMYFFHAAHWALWGHPELLEKSLLGLEAMIPAGQKMAALEKAKGTKWPKMTDPAGNESPSGVGPVLCWQQPHPLFMAELVYRANPTPETLHKLKRIVYETADYMATIVDLDEARGEYVLGPGVSSGDEKHTDVAHNLNPTMEIGYFKYTLDIARAWRRRLGEAPDPAWDAVSAKLAKPIVREGVYPALEFPVESRPAFMATWLLGVMPGEGIDRAAIARNLAADKRNEAPQDAVTWGVGMAAMTAARLGDRERAVQYLCAGYNTNPFRPSGNVIRRPDQTPVYYPANGAWLTAAAMMAAGWDGAEGPTPGFPKAWQVRWENLRPLP